MSQKGMNKTILITESQAKMLLQEREREQFSCCEVWRTRTFWH